MGWDRCDRARIQLEAWRDLGGDPGEELRHIGRHGPRQIGGDATPLAATAFVEDRDPRLEAGAVLGEGSARHSAGEDQMGRLGQAAEGLGPGRRIRRETGAGDGNQPSTGGKPRERRAQMARCRLGRPAIDIGHGREGRVHQDDARANARVQMIVDLRGVESGDGTPRKEEAQKIGAGVGQLVQREAAARDLGEDRQKPGPGRRLEDQVTRRDLRGSQRRKPHGQRRRELLEPLHLLRAPGMRRQEARHLGEDRQQRRRRAGPGQQRAAEFPQEEDERHLARLIGKLPVPGAIGIGAAKGALHLKPQTQRVDLEALGEIGLQRFGHGEDRGRGIARRNRNGRRNGREIGHRETPE